MRIAYRVLPILFPLSACTGAPIGTGPAFLPPHPRYHMLEATSTGADLATPKEIIAPPDKRQQLAVTIYQGDVARVNDDRQVTLAAGSSILRFPDVSPKADATSLQLEALDQAPMPDVTRQELAPASLSPETALAAFIGKTIQIRWPAEANQPARWVDATLLGTAGGAVVKIGERIYTQPPGVVSLPALPSGLSPTTSLAWHLENARIGTRSLRASYLTGGLSWQADYSLVLSAEGNKGSWSAWATLNNQTGSPFTGTKVTVVAGAPIRNRFFTTLAPAPVAASVGSGTEPSGLQEFHSYDLAGLLDLPKDQVTQAKLFDPAMVDVERVYRFESQVDTVDANARALDVRLDLLNSKRNGLGLPLPAGQVRVYGPVGSDARALLGSDHIDNTPVDEPFHINLGSAFDLVGRHTQTEVKQPSEHERVVTCEVDLHNHKAADVKVDVIEHPLGAWSVTSSNSPAKRVSATELNLTARIPAGGSAHLTYTVKMTF